MKKEIMVVVPGRKTDGRLLVCVDSESAVEVLQKCGLDRHVLKKAGSSGFIPNDDRVDLWVDDGDQLTALPVIAVK